MDQLSLIAGSTCNTVHTTHVYCPRGGGKTVIFEIGQGQGGGQRFNVIQYHISLLVVFVYRSSYLY